MAAFQTDNLAALQKQKFAESLENAFISSASDFYGILNRMSAEPDFKRLLTEFALGEFRRGLVENEVSEQPATAVDPIAALSNRANRYVSQHFGKSPKWLTINQAVWSTIGKRKDHALTLTDMDTLAKALSVEPNEVLAVLALLSRPGSGLLAMVYDAEGRGRDSSVSKDEVANHLRAWWRDETITDDDWRSWAGKIIVEWSPAETKEDNK